MRVIFEATLGRMKQLVADFRANEKFHLSTATDSELQFTLPDVLKVPPISQHGNVVEIIGMFAQPIEHRQRKEYHD